VPTSSITGMARVGSMPPAAVKIASLPIDTSMPPTPQSPIPRTCSASVARIRSISPGPAPRLANASSIASAWSIERYTPRGRRHSWWYCSIAKPTVRSLTMGDHFAKVLRKQPVEQDLVAVVQGGQVDVLAERIRQLLVLHVGALDLISQGADIRRKQTREAQRFSFFRREGGPLFNSGELRTAKPRAWVSQQWFPFCRGFAIGANSGITLCRMLFASVSVEPLH